MRPQFTQLDFSATPPPESHSLSPIFLCLATARCLPRNRLEDIQSPAPLAENDIESAREVIARKQQIKDLANAANEEIASQLFRKAGENVTRFRIASDIVHQIGRLFYHVRRIAKTIAET